MSQARPQTFLIGFRESDPRVHLMRSHDPDAQRPRAGGRMRTSASGMILAGRCGDCRHNVWLNASGVQAMRERDCVVYCADCAAGSGYDNFIADLG